MCVCTESLFFGLQIRPSCCRQRCYKQSVCLQHSIKPSADVYTTMCRPRPLGSLQDLLAAGHTPTGPDAERATGAFGSRHGSVTHGSASSLADSARGGSIAGSVARIPAGSSRLGAADGDAPAATSAVEVIVQFPPPPRPRRKPPKILETVCAC